MRFIWLGDIFQHFLRYWKASISLSIQKFTLKKPYFENFWGATAPLPPPRYVRPCHIFILYQHVSWLYTSKTICFSFTEDIVYVNEGETFTLPCKNQTKGSFYGIVWKTTAVPHKSSLYSYDHDSGYNVEETIDGRSQLLKQTYLQIRQARSSDTGLYECNLLYTTSRGSLGAQLMSIINVVVYGEYDLHLIPGVLATCISSMPLLCLFYASSMPLLRPTLGIKKCRGQKTAEGLEVAVNPICNITWHKSGGGTTAPWPSR